MQFTRSDGRLLLTGKRFEIKCDHIALHSQDNLGASFLQMDCQSLSPLPHRAAITLDAGIGPSFDCR